MKKILVMSMLISMAFGDVRNIERSTSNTFSVFCSDNYTTSIQKGNNVCTYDGKETKCSTWSIDQAAQWACRNHNNSTKKARNTIKIKNGAVACNNLKGLKRNLQSEISMINVGFGEDKDCYIMDSGTFLYVSKYNLSKQTFTVHYEGKTYHKKYIDDAIKIKSKSGVIAYVRKSDTY
ncbi:hypothetical protein C9926_03195 [Sulfurovum lithotrophicum]|nr:hypothetical protein C9926_03195 [Sulfurovum lithotrophicum]